MLFSSASKKYILFLFLLIGTQPALSQNYERLRNKMVRDQIVARGITHRSTLQAMRTVERHLFVDSQLANKAYEDNPLPIGHGQTISQPFIVAYMTSLVEPRPHFRILEIGTGSGYQAAVLAEIADSVFTMEIIPELGEIAEKRLEALGYENVRVIVGDGYRGLPEKAPFHAIVVTAGAEHIPPPLLEQLAEGGKMIIPVGSQFAVQYLILIEKKKGRITTKNMMPVRFVPFTR
ncbi:MAG: protein-L-isoaspartate(D-aspartate) O-methyltransferase [Bacteroidales bacterium]|jgi:protein-L-isoaspartate(D-aspartate) O-methyltransferase|nr:protein-L-isoaspartate(D-aspartate) O-methyltransferase [Bacteroidales bacterium]HKM30752.1 protein-L-isoaspartate(D-aspartate) O-methyltransferase [Bacteroidales bacterium]